MLIVEKSAQLTRRVLIDSARKAKSEKRGLGWQRAPLDAELAWLGERVGVLQGLVQRACEARLAALRSDAG